MREVKKSWMGVLAATLLVSTLVGVVWARPQNRPQAADITRKVTLTGADFTPCDDTFDWWNDGCYVHCESGLCAFVAPVVFPCLPSVTVERIKLHVNDSNVSECGYAGLQRAYPTTGAYVNLGKVESPEGTSGGLQTYTSPNINQVVWPSQKAYIWLEMGGPNVDVYGVTVEYHRNI